MRKRSSLWIGTLLLAAAVHTAGAQTASLECPDTYDAGDREGSAQLRLIARPRVEQAAAAASAGATPPASLSATFVATTEAAANELRAWWQTQPGVLVDVRPGLPPSAPELEAYAAIRASLPPGQTFTPAAGLCPGWDVHVEGMVGALSKADVAAWFELLRSVPENPRWKLRGIGVSQLPS